MSSVVYNTPSAMDEVDYRVVGPEELIPCLDAPDIVLLDVRTPREFAQYRVPGSVLIPVEELNRRYHELNPDRPTVCICEHGIRSEAAAHFLSLQDFADVATLRGGLSQWPGPLERSAL